MNTERNGIIYGKNTVHKRQGIQIRREQIGMYTDYYLLILIEQRNGGCFLCNQGFKLLYKGAAVEDIKIKVAFCGMKGRKVEQHLGGVSGYCNQLSKSNVKIRRRVKVSDFFACLCTSNLKDTILIVYRKMGGKRRAAVGLQENNGAY